MPAHATTRLTITSGIVLVLLLSFGCATAPEPVEDTGPIFFPKPPDEPRFVYERTLFSTGSARALSDKDRFRTLLTGAPTREGTGFSKPFDIAVHQGRVYITDTVHRAVLAIDFPEEHGFTFGDRGDDGDLRKPLGITISDDGNVYVCDGTLRAVQVYDSQGSFLRQIDISKWTQRPSGIDISPDGSRLFVVDTGGIDSDDHRVLIVDANSGKLIRTIGTRGKAEGEMNLPRDIHLGKDGLLYVTDGGNFRVQVYAQDGEYVRTWGQPGRRLGQFSRPKGISVDPEGNIYVADAAFGNFQIFTTEGELLMFIGERSTTLDAAKFMLPAGIDVDENGRIFMVDQFFRKVDVFRPVEIGENEGWLGKRKEAKK